MNYPNHTERKEAADKAKQAMLEKFRAKAQETQPDPDAIAQRAELERQREEKRIAAEERRKARIAAEKVQRIAEAKKRAEEEAARLRREAIEAQKRRKAEAEAAEIRAFEEQAKRDLINAAKRLRK